MRKLGHDGKCRSEKRRKERSRRVLEIYSAMHRGGLEFCRIQAHTFTYMYIHAHTCT